MGEASVAAGLMHTQTQNLHWQRQPNGHTGRDDLTQNITLNDFIQHCHHGNNGNLDWERDGHVMGTDTRQMTLCGEGLRLVLT